MSSPEQTSAPSMRVKLPSATVFRLATIGWMIGWYAKVDNNLLLAAKAKHMPVIHPAFEGIFASHTTLLFLQAVPLAMLPLVWLGRRRLLITASSVLILCSLVALMHLLLFNDATFVTSLWAAVWLLWLAVSSPKDPAQGDDPSLKRRAPQLALVVVSLMFLGGFIGKMTPEFWSGEMFYHYFFLDRDILHYPWLRQNLAPDTLREVATWFSRFVVLMEGGLMVACLFPFRKIAPLALLCMAGIVLGSTPWLLSVFGSMFGLVLANYMWPKDGAAS